MSKPLTPARIIRIATPRMTEIKANSESPYKFNVEAIDDSIIEIVPNLSQKDHHQLLKILDDYYHNDISLVSDEIYDAILEEYEKKYGNYKQIGSEPRGTMVDLPYFLASLNKPKDEIELNRWVEKHSGPYIIEDKIDGATLLLISQLSEQGTREIKLYTRGGGKRGKDVSHLVSYLNLPFLDQDIAIRGEVVISKESFQKLTGYKNARNAVSGTLGSIQSFKPEIAKLLEFYAYRIITDNTPARDQIVRLMQIGFKTPAPMDSSMATWEILETYLNQRKDQAPYDIDGLVVYQNVTVEYPEDSNPDHVIAFKIGSETAITEVIDVEWSAGKGGYLTPVVIYKPVHLSGAELSRASGYNAKFIINNGIGPGAKILLVRSGETIPKILSVIEQVEPKLPDVNVHGEYELNDSGVEFELLKENDQVLVARLKHFITSLDIKNVGPKRIETLVNNGITDIDKLLNISQLDLQVIPGFGKVIANNLYKDLHDKLNDVNLSQIMDASGFFPNVGQKRFEAILAEFPDILTSDNVVYKIQQIKGFNKLADNIANNLPKFKVWLESHPQIKVKLPTVISSDSNDLAGQTIVFSGFRDKDLENRIKVAGGKVTSTVTGNTTLVIIKNMSFRKGKVVEAENRGVTIMTKEEFLSQYSV